MMASKNFKFQVSSFKLTVCCLVTFVCLAATTHAQKVSATINREKILIGEQVELQLKAENIDRDKVDIAAWFNVPDTFNHLEVVNRLPIDTIQLSNGFTYIQKINLTSFDSGFWVLPQLNIVLNNKQSLITPPLTITVLPVDVTAMQDYHDIKDVLQVKLHNDWRIIIGITLLALISIFGLLWVLSKRKETKMPKPKQVPGFGNPYEFALQQLQALQQRNLLQGGQHKLFYTELVSICRNFSDTQLHINSSTRTTDEYLMLIKGRVGNETMQVQYFQLLRLADAVKFAKFIPSQQDNDEALATAKTFIETVNRFYTKN